jgi:hypothetical protein
MNRLTPKHKDHRVHRCVGREIKLSTEKAFFEVVDKTTCLSESFMAVRHFIPCHLTRTTSTTKGGGPHDADCVSLSQLPRRR